MRHPPRFVGISNPPDGNPQATVAMCGQEFSCDDPDWLAELAVAAKHACVALMTERARIAQAVALDINKETRSGPEDPD